eukprot:g5098.t1
MFIPLLLATHILGLRAAGLWARHHHGRGVFWQSCGTVIRIARDFHWPSTCDDLSSDRLPVLEVSGPRSGPFRDYAGLLRLGALPLYLSFHEEPSYHEQPDAWSRNAEEDDGATGQV